MTICFVCLVPYKALTGGAHPLSHCQGRRRRGARGEEPALVAVVVCGSRTRTSATCCWVFFRLIPFSGRSHCPAPCLLYIFGASFVGRGIVRKTTEISIFHFNIFEIYAQASSKSQSKQNKCRATEIISRVPKSPSRKS